MENPRQRSGDSGMTSLGDGTMVSKGSDRVSAYGAIDELDCFAGLARIEVLESLPPGPDRDLAVRSLETVQNACWLLAASLAAPGRECPEAPQIQAGIEQLAVEMERAAGPVSGFVIPGSSRAEALLHVARAVCRRAERDVVELFGVLGDGAAIGWELAVLNRMSSLLFAASRLALKARGIPVSYRGR
ncbi:MAG TPA: cob(I)yrinic acid a,c-diamide adenosyltransferase [Myxococcota bacterium]|nr:cob(I)yrinic acid a,c-diamide adenosyltransferase [Myxococcota bacterium]